MAKILREYEAVIDTKRRCVLRGAHNKRYHVREFQDGHIELYPDTTSDEDKVSAKTLDMMDTAVEHLKKGRVSEPVDLDSIQ